ncbi:hypothetical protein BBJ28_00005632 [Nothophytophthora sp. Chile5]|nr:hypothetical protein BBJ28_00005632 [Nothophytophthora sp. Chile5]
MLTFQQICWKMKSEDVQGESLSPPDEYDLLQFARTYFSEGESPASIDDGNQEGRVLSSSADGQSGTLSSQLNSEKQSDLLLDETVDMPKDAVEEATELLDTITISPATASHPLLEETNAPTGSSSDRQQHPVLEGSPLLESKTLEGGQDCHDSRSLPDEARPPPYPSDVHLDNALQYLHKVKQQCPPEIYNQFLDVMKDFKTQTLDTLGAIQRVHTLFKDHPNLIQGFNTFLLPADHIRPDTSVEVKASVPVQASHAPLHAPSSFRAVQPLQQQQAIPSGDSSANNFDRATSYLAAIKQRFVDDPETFNQFLDILQTFQKHQQSAHQVLDQVCLLFRDHPDLLRGFAFFMPDEIQEQAREQLDRAAEKAQQQVERRVKDSQGDGAASASSRL